MLEMAKNAVIRWQLGMISEDIVASYRNVLVKTARNAFDIWQLSLGRWSVEGLMSLEIGIPG